jgi:hypothetical protein
MIVAMLFSVLLVILSVAIHYETLRFTWLWLPRLRLPPRQKIIAVIVAAFAAHTVEIWLHAIAYYLLTDHYGIGTFGGNFDKTFPDYLYFATVTYTSLGLGDVYPLGGLRLLAGVETLTGLILIAWSASFTYLAMEKFWVLHGKQRKTTHTETRVR